MQHIACKQGEDQDQRGKDDAVSRRHIGHTEYARADPVARDDTGRQLYIMITNLTQKAIARMIYYKF